MNMALEKEHYLAPLKYDWLTSFYDPLLRWTLREEKFKRQLIQQANIAQNHRVLDVGCGTATLTLLIKQLYPHAEVFGLDGDVKALAIAQNKKGLECFPSLIIPKRRMLLLAACRIRWAKRCAPQWAITALGLWLVAGKCEGAESHRENAQQQYAFRFHLVFTSFRGFDLFSFGPMVIWFLKLNTIKFKPGRGCLSSS